MGIPSYFSYIVRNHPDILIQLQNKNFMIDNFYLDCNSIIYDVIHNIDFAILKEDETDIIIKNVCSKIDEYIQIIKPVNNLMVAFDGVAPVAKLNQQRERRYKSLFQTKITRSIYKNVKSDPWNTSAITPGTTFMNKLNERIKNYYNDPKKYQLNNIIISTSSNYGEGEHKIFDFIRNFPSQHSSKTTVIYGLDADLIMLGINHLPICEKIYLFRETPQFIQSINSDLEPNKEYILDLPELAKTITLNMNNNEELSLEQKKNRVYDYIFLCFFLGNDFMPHFPSINIRTGGIDKMIGAYKSVIGNTNENLTDGKKIFWKNVGKLVKFLSSNEEQYIKDEMKLRDKKEKYKIADETSEDKYKKFENIPMYERSIEKHINPFNENWRERYYTSLFNISDYDENRIKQICINYLEGLEWTMKYYTTGCCDWRWSYNYDYPPLLCDLVKFIPSFETEFISNKIPNPVSELVQLCYVLPKESLQLLPANIYNQLMKTYSDWYQNDCDFIWAYCKYFWESHVVLPHIDIDELEIFVKSIL
uniref:Xrn1 N-terminal domain-containing protein n=1 Tax=viral metagenome TaxID=1070528 RepID=A0A6C0DGM6_9ZZZZ